MEIIDQSGESIQDALVRVAKEQAPVCVGWILICIREDRESAHVAALGAMTSRDDLHDIVDQALDQAEDDYSQGENPGSLPC